MTQPVTQQADEVFAFCRVGIAEDRDGRELHRRPARGAADRSRRREPCLRARLRCLRTNPSLKCWMWTRMSSRGAVPSRRCARNRWRAALLSARRSVLPCRSRAMPVGLATTSRVSSFSVWLQGVPCRAVSRRGSRRTRVPRVRLASIRTALDLLREGLQIAAQASALRAPSSMAGVWEASCGDAVPRLAKCRTAPRNSGSDGCGRPGTAKERAIGPIRIDIIVTRAYHPARCYN